VRLRQGAKRGSEKSPGKATVMSLNSDIYDEKYKMLAH